MNILFKAVISLGVLYGFKHFLGSTFSVAPQKVIETLDKGVQFIKELDDSLTIVLDAQAQNFQGNEEAIQTFISKGLTGENHWNIYVMIRDGRFPDILGFYSPPTQPAEWFLEKARELAGDPRWSILQNWLTQQANIYMAFYNNQPGGK